MITLRTALFAAMLGCAVSAQAANVWGTVVWKTGVPVAGIELRLLQKGQVLPTRIFTNPAGRYGLYNLATPTSDYTLQLLRRGSVVKEIKLPPLKNGDRVPDIVIS